MAHERGFVKSFRGSLPPKPIHQYTLRTSFLEGSQQDTNKHDLWIGGILGVLCEFSVNYFSLGCIFYFFFSCSEHLLLLNKKN